MVLAAAMALGFWGAGAAERGVVVFEGIRLHATQVSAVWGTHANGRAQALDGSLMSEAQTRREREEARAAIAHQPSAGVCESIEGIRGAAGARALETAATEQGGDAVVAWLVRDTERLPGLTGPGEVRARSDEVLGRFCNAGRTVGGGELCRGDPGDHAADVHPGAVLGHRTFHDGEDAIAAMEWVRNIAMPVPLEVVAPRAVRSEAAMRAMLAGRGRDARVALATGYLQGRVSARLPAVSAGGWAGAVGVEGRNEETISRHELLGVLSRERYERPGMLARLQGEARANVLREWIVAEASGLMVSFEAYRDAERRGATLAARLAQAIETDRDR